MVQLQIAFKDGHFEDPVVDSYKVQDNTLVYYIRFGEDAGYTYIPYDQIKKFRASTGGV